MTGSREQGRSARGAKRFARCLAGSSLAGLLFASPAPWRAEPVPARLQGLVRGLDGRPAMGLGIRLIDEAGGTGARAETGAGGFYTVDVVPGSYAIVLDTPGAPAPVLAPDVRLPAGSLVRRDVQLVESDPAEISRRLRGIDASFAEWWRGLPTAGKATFVVGVVVGVGFGVAALSGGGDGDEAPASPM